MAVQIHKEPTNFLNPVYDDIIYTLKNATPNVFNHKFILQVYVTNGYLPLAGQIDVLVATLKAKVNLAASVPPVIAIEVIESRD